MIHKHAAPDEWIDKVFAVMALAGQHTFQVLTKRPEVMARHVARIGRTLKYEVQRDIADAIGRRAGEVIGLVPWPLRNVWLGVSAERQQEADGRIPKLLQTPAEIRFVSLEPLLGPIDMSAWPSRVWLRTIGSDGAAMRAGLDWVIVGGESGPHARDMDPEWARDLRDQCAAAGVAFFQKQMARKAPIPPDLMVRQLPR